MRPALENYAGIPQETRLLFRGMCMLECIEVEGMLQSPHRFLSQGTRVARWPWGKLSIARKINRYSKLIISMEERQHRNIMDWIVKYQSRYFKLFWHTLLTFVGLSSIKLSNFESEHFKDFVWRMLFAKTLPATDFDLVSHKNHKVCSVPWKIMHSVGLNTQKLFLSPVYPVIDMKGIDIFISQTPFPARIGKQTAVIVRYHDVIPVFMPHTIPEKTWHQATHYYSLVNAVKRNSYFACVSESTRSELLKIFPEIADRAVTIHNMISHHYFPDDTPGERVTSVIRSRLYEDSKWLPEFFTHREKEYFYSKHLANSPLKYLLMVSTIEPRKNHLRLLAAWETIKLSTEY